MFGFRSRLVRLSRPWLDEEKSFAVQPGLEHPIPHVASRLRNAGTIWELLKPKIAEHGEMVEKDSEIIVTPSSDPLLTPFGEVTPIIVWNAEAEELSIALIAEDLAICRGDGPRLASSESFQNATAGFPDKASISLYLSSDIFRLVENLAKKFAPEAPQEFIGEVLPYLTKLGTDGGYAVAVAVEDDGFLTIGNFPFPVKGGRL